MRDEGFWLSRSRSLGCLLYVCQEWSKLRSTSAIFLPVMSTMMVESVVDMTATSL